MNRMKILSGGFQGISRCAAHLRQGGILAIPTETVYGLAGVATDPAAVSAIFAAKERPSFDPLIVHVPRGWGSLAKLDELGLTESRILSDQGRNVAEKLMRKFWPGPLTLVLPRGSAIPDLVTSGLGTVGIRMPRHALAQDLLQALQLPLAAPSANRFGSISPTTSEAVTRELNGRVPYVLEGGPCEVGLESTIVHVGPDAALTLLRPGGVPAEDIEAVTGSGLLPPPRGERPSGELAPGMLASHYAPRKKLTLFDRSSPPRPDEHSGNLWISPPPEGVGAGNLGGAPGMHRVLSASGDLQEAARGLFSALRSLDEDPNCTQLRAERPAQGGGLAAAILDRLTRAAAPRS